jgi:uracil-DNA glycosylase
MWFEQMHPKWRELIEAQKPLLDSLESQLATLSNLVPSAAKVMAAFEGDPAQIKVVILGQDPYPTEGVAVGHSFAIAESTKVPASLKNIETELFADVGAKLTDPTLSAWREQGVWLLNRTLTTEVGAAGAHSNLGWQQFTAEAVQALTNQQPLVLLLWGSHAQSILKKVDFSPEQTKVISSVHPSPLSSYRGFFGSKPFSKINQALVELGLSRVNW